MVLVIRVLGVADLSKEVTDIDVVDSYSSIHDHECNCIGESRVFQQSYFLHVYLNIQKKFAGIS